MDNELGWQLSWPAIILTIIPFGQTELYVGPLNVIAKTDNFETNSLILCRSVNYKASPRYGTN
jgi:hypothetical protein